MKANRYYITTTLPYVNASPHIGFALEIIQADVLARYRRAQGDEVFFNTGTDEHGIKIYRAALEKNKTPQAYVDEVSKQFDELKRVLNVSYDKFIRTTDPHHLTAAQEFWKRCAANGDIEKRQYAGKYCVGCELEKTESELESGRCPLHPSLNIEIVKEENYFFNFSKYQQQLLNLYRERSDFVVPPHRLNEIRSFVERGLNDFSISRLKEKMPWGIPVPGDENHVMYVWFDALVNYISTLGWPEDEAMEGFWPGTQIAGKDNLRQQSAMWQAMLLSAGVKPSKQIFIHGFITSEGKKMSKSEGNVVDPFDVTKKYGTDSLRYYLLREIVAHEDGDFSVSKFEERYNADLANGLGNFAARVLALAEPLPPIAVPVALPGELAKMVENVEKEIKVKIGEFKFHEALGILWGMLRAGDIYVNETKPWELKGEKEKTSVLQALLGLLKSVAINLEPFLPEAASKIMAALGEKNKLFTITKIEALFPRLP